MLDEPFSALDSYLREEVEGEVGGLLAGFGGTALLVTHNRDEAYRLCRDMIVMDGGQVLRTGGTKEVFADPQSTTAARLTGCKNILSCTRVDAHTVRLTGWDAPLRLAAEVPETCTAVGIRAHDFAPCAPAAPNALPVQLNSTSENPFDWNLIFTAPDGTTRLWWKVSKTNLTAASPEAPAFLGIKKQVNKRQMPHGKQTLKQLMKQNAGVSNIEITKDNIKAFESTAKKYGIDFALKKDATENPPRYLVFFKARDADALTAAFKEFSAKKLSREQKPSIRKALAAFRDKAKQLNANREKVKKKERGIDR